MKFVLLFSVLIILSQVVSAETHYGGGVSYGPSTVKDPNKSTGNTNDLSISGIMTMPINRNYSAWRYWFEVGYNSFELDATNMEIGQRVTSASFTSIAQYGFSVSPDYRPWIGLGVGVGLNDFVDRLTLDEDGFIDEEFKDRSVTSLFIVFNSGASLRKTQAGLVFGVSFSHKVPLDDGIESSTLDFFFLY